jgi:hypothetical protein
MIDSMLSVTSLAAFSSSGIGPVHPTPVRAVGSASPGALPRPSPPGLPTGTGEGAAAPSRTLPRGSLLDLSV